MNKAPQAFPLHSLALLLLLVFCLPGLTPAGATGPLSQIAGEYDVIVVGGDAEGVAAAVAAARAGASTLLIDTRPVLGGLLTRGWLNTIDLNLDSRQRPLNGGIFGEIYRELDDHSFDVADMEKILARVVAREKKLTLLPAMLTVLPVIATQTMPLYRPGQTLSPDEMVVPAHLVTDAQPALQTNDYLATLTGVRIYADAETSVLVYGKRFIDATQDADLAVAAGAGWVAYGDDVWGQTRNMATTLVFRLSGISDADWRTMCDELARQKGSGMQRGGRRNSIWGFGAVMQKYSPLTRRIRMRGLNLGRQKDGSVLVNALLVFGIDGLDRESRKEARRIAEAELPHLLDFLRKNIPGMSSARMAGTAPELYVRTSRQIKTLYTLTVDDVLENRDSYDRVGFGSYPLDIQAQSPDHAGDVTGNPEQYAIPLRCLIPRGFSNLSVIGRSAGFDSLAQSSARTVPAGMAAGQGAAVASVLSIRRKISIAAFVADKIAVGEMQQVLSAQGVRVAANPAQIPELTRHWAYAGLQFMRRQGQVSGGYTNEYFLDQPMAPATLVNRLAFMFPGLDKAVLKDLYAFAETSKILTLGAACAMLDYVEMPSRHSSPFAELVQKEDAYEKFVSRGIFAHPWPAGQFDPRQPLPRGSGFMLLMRWHHELKP